MNLKTTSLLLLSLFLIGCNSYDVVTTNNDGDSRTEKVDKRTGAATHLFLPSVGWRSFKEIREAAQAACQKIERPCRPDEPGYGDHGNLEDLYKKYAPCYDYAGECSDKSNYKLNSK